MARTLYKGLTLDRNNKFKLQDLVSKPNTLYRNLYRPILIWNIEGEDFAVVGQNGFTESIIQLTTNAIPWGKAPDEWMSNKCFKNYVHRKEDEHDKWLDDEVEKRLITDSLHYFRNVTSIKTPNGNQTLIQKGIGEIDFIIIHHDSQKIYVADCKHLLSRYDMINQKNDYTNFIKTPKGYNSQIENKITWLQTNLENINYHYHSEYDSPHDISNYGIEGIFIINTPTFYMFNSEYRIYTVDVVVEIIQKRLKDPEFAIFIEDDDTSKYLRITYPYFKKPAYHLIDTLGTEE